MDAKYEDYYNFYILECIKMSFVIDNFCTT